jgi:hypothetical protein
MTSTKLLFCLLSASATACVVGCGSSGGNNPVVTDPCAGATPVKASFTIYEVVGAAKVATDTVVFGPVLFSADERYDSYEWRIGTDSRVWSDSSFGLAFWQRDADEGVPIPVQFVGRRAPQTDCFPNDDGVDTIVRYLVPVSLYNSPILGSYRGYRTDDTTDVYEVDIFWKNRDALVVRNINKGCRDSANQEYALTVKEMGAKSISINGVARYDGRGCKNPFGTLILHNDGRLVANYVYDKDRKQATFIGRKVQKP